MRILTACTCLLFMTVSSQLAFAQGRAQADDVGRYQLFQGQYRFINVKGEEHWIRALFKIDTKTGKLFICEGTQVNGKYVSALRVFFSAPQRERWRR